MRWNPVYGKELKTGVRTVKMTHIIMGYNGLLALFGLFSFYLTFEYSTRYGGRINYSDILQIYAIIAATEFGLVLFTVPALTAGTISGEREKQTLDILLSTRLKPMEIILGKLGSSISTMVLLAFSGLPIMALVFSIGGITMTDLGAFMALILVTAVFIGSIGIFFSSLFRKTTAATVATYGTLLLLSAGTILLLVALGIISELRHSSINTSGVYIPPDVGNWLLLLLVNPAMTGLSLIDSQISTGDFFAPFLHEFGTVPVWIEEHWFFTSITVQLILSVIFILWSARLLDPLRERRHKKNNK